MGAGGGDTRELYELNKLPPAAQDGDTAPVGAADVERELKSLEKQLSES